MKVALYTRVSTEDQAREGFSLQVQKEFLLDYAKNFGWDVFCSIDGCEVYEDDGYSGYNMERPALQRLIFDVQSKKVDVVIVYKQDRLSRNLKELLSFLEELDDLKIGFKSATEPFDTTTSAGKLAIQMLGSYAEFERNRLIERVFPGMVAGVKKGHWQGSRFTPYGYIHNKETKKLEVFPEEAERVKEIFKMYLEGKSTSQIAAHYYRLGISSRTGGKFYTKFIADILKNEVYIGTLIWNKRRYEMKEKTKNGHGKGYKTVKNSDADVIVVPNAHESIIENQDFERVQKLLSRNQRNSVVRFKNNVYHFSGVLKCHCCGKNYRGKMVMTNSAKSSKKPWYYCSSYGVHYLHCDNKAVTADAIHNQIWSILDVICENIHVIEELGDVMRAAKEEPEELYQEQLKEKDALLAKNLEKQKGLYQIYKEDKININIYKDEAEVLRNEEKRIKSETKQLQLKILEKNNSLDVVKETQTFLVDLERCPDVPDERVDYALKTFMRIIFKAIYVHNQEIVKVEINQPWKCCYEEGLKWTEKKENKTESQPIQFHGDEQSFWRPTAVK